MLNVISLMGRLTRDPELRRTGSGIAVASFTLAVERDIKNKDTGLRDTDFIDCVAWRNTAEFVSKYFQKGKAAAVKGSLQIRDWTDKDGNKRRNAEVLVDSIYFADSRQDAAPVSGALPPSQPQSGDFQVMNEDDGNLPF